LSVQARLWPQRVFLRGRETLLHPQELRKGLRSIGVGLVGGAPAAGLLDDIDRVAAAQEELRPALASIGGAGEIGGGLRRAGNEHQRIGLRKARRNLVLDVGLTAQHLLVADRRILATDEEVALLGDRQRFLGTD